MKSKQAAQCAACLLFILCYAGIYVNESPL